ncbi:hypothetical protein C8Q79DRAFT_916877 [Trametes meyenii]|nr:hypothetical protein C8Q79DRAFT_916877 [Trametes meyenii]
MEDDVVPQVSDSPSLRGLDFDNITRDEEFWFHDGSLVIVAGGTAFKIYKHLFASQSTIVADMLVATDPQVVEIFDGCPVVQLSDSSHDLRHLLRILIPSSKRRIHLRENASGCSFNQLASLVRMAHKYCIEDVEQQAISCLKLYFTQDFDEWEKGQGLFGMVQNPSRGIGALHLAQLTQNRDMYPVALYTCALAQGDIVEGWRREDGTVEYLSLEDLAKCIRGYGKLCTEAARLPARVFDTEPPDTCTTPEECEGLIQDLCHEAECWFPQCLDLLHNSTEMINETKMCGKCKALLHERDKDERRKLWDWLTFIFDCLDDSDSE